MGQKISSTEKTKHRLVTELEDLQLEYERVHAAAVITEKRGRNFDKVFEKPELVLYVFSSVKNLQKIDCTYNIQTAFFPHESYQGSHQFHLALQEKPGELR